VTLDTNHPRNGSVPALTSAYDPGRFSPSTTSSRSGSAPGTTSAGAPGRFRRRLSSVCLSSPPGPLRFSHQRLPVPLQPLPTFQHDEIIITPHEVHEAQGMPRIADPAPGGPLRHGPPSGSRRKVSIGKKPEPMNWAVMLDTVPSALPRGERDAPGDREDPDYSRSWLPKGFSAMNRSSWRRAR